MIKSTASLREGGVLSLGKKKAGCEVGETTWENDE